MSTRSVAERAVPLVLGLSLLLVAEALVVAPRAFGAAGSGRAEATISTGTTTDVLRSCVTGFGDIRERSEMSLHGVTATSTGAVAVGFARRRTQHGAERRAAALYATADRWSRTFVPSPGAEDGFVSVASGSGRSAWAVGFTTVQGRIHPLAMRWNGRGWKVDKPPPRGRMPTLLTDVHVVGGTEPLVVGYRMTPRGQRKPVAARRVKGKWRYIDPVVGKRESMSLVAIAPDRSGGLWVVGHGGRGTYVRPKILHRTKRRWQRVEVPLLKGESVLADVVATGPRNAWSVGYQRKDGRTMPLVMRWNGKRWRRAAAPDFGSRQTLLRAVSAPGSGGVWVVGSSWDEAARTHEAVAAWWDGQSWTTVSGLEGGNELHDVVGSLHDGGWAVGRAGPDGRTTRVCDRPQASIFGGSEPEAVDGSVAAGPGRILDGTDAAIEADPDAALDEDDHDDFDGATGGGDSGGAATAAGSDDAAATGAVTTSRGKRRATSGKQRRRRPVVRELPQPRPDPAIVARDVVDDVGLADQFNSYGAIAEDFDRDGDVDLYVGRHGRPARLLLNDGGVFSIHREMRFPSIDRHGCSAADVDGSGLPDLYCAIGGRRGSGLKSNELWIDPGGPAPVERAVQMGVADPTGRGREAVFLHSDGDYKLDLVITNSPTRIDGLPSLGRLFRVDDDGSFSARARIGFAPRFGAQAVQAADADGDGRDDLLLVAGEVATPGARGTRLYRNTPSGLRDITARSGIRRFDAVDARLVDLDGDGRLDLVQLSEKRLRVSLWRRGRFRTAWTRKLTHGRSVAAGDVDGDGREDLYIVRGNRVRNPSDVMLVNRGRGDSFRAIPIPQAGTGDGDRAVAIDHDGNGLTDFLVLNGRNERGPTQLVAFYPRDTARSSGAG